MRDIGKNIRDLRVRKNLTQEELAERLFVTRQTVSNYENGKSRPDVDMIVRIAEVMDTDANTVFYGIPTPPDKKRAYRQLVIGMVLLLIFAIVYWSFAPVAEQLGQRHYRFGLRNILIFYVSPLAFLFFGWCLLHGLSIALQFKELNGSWVRWCKWTTFSATLLLLLITLPWMAFSAYADYLVITTGSVNLAFPNIPVLSELMWFTMMMDAKAPAVYALLGCALRLFRFPK